MSEVSSLAPGSEHLQGFFNPALTSFRFFRFLDGLNVLLAMRVAHSFERRSGCSIAAQSPLQILGDLHNSVLGVLFHGDSHRRANVFSDGLTYVFLHPEDVHSPAHGSDGTAIWDAVERRLDGHTPFGSEALRDLRRNLDPCSAAAPLLDHRLKIMLLRFHCSRI